MWTKTKRTKIVPVAAMISFRVTFDGCWLSFCRTTVSPCPRAFSVTLMGYSNRVMNWSYHMPFAGGTRHRDAPLGRFADLFGRADRVHWPENRKRVRHAVAG